MKISNESDIDENIDIDEYPQFPEYDTDLSVKNF